MDMAEERRARVSSYVHGMVVVDPEVGSSFVQ